VRDKWEVEKRENVEPRVWRVVFIPKEGVRVRLLDCEEVEDVRGAEDRVGFLPSWFWDGQEGGTAMKGGQHQHQISSPVRPTKTVVPPGWEL